MPTPTEPREEMVDGEQKYTYDPKTPDDDPWADVEPEVRREQDNDYIAEQMAEQFDADDL